MSKKPSATAQIIVLCNSLTQAVKELNEKLTKIDENARIEYSDLCNRLDQLEGKIAAVAKGRRTTGTRGGSKSSSAAPATPQGPKPYSNSMYYFKGEWAKNQDKIKEAYCTEEMLEALKEHCESDSKIKGMSGDRRLKAEAAWLWNTYIKAAKSDDDEVKKAKTELRDTVKRDYTAHKKAIEKQNNTPAAKEDDKKAKEDSK